LWEAASGKELLTFKGHGDFVSSLNPSAYSPDGRRIVTGNGEATAKVWEAASVQEVAAWQSEEKSAAALQRERAAARAQRFRLPGTINRWLVLAPMPVQGQTHEGAVKALDEEQIPSEARLRPRAGERVKPGASELVWNTVQREDGLIDFNHLLGKETEWSVAYAICCIRSEAARAGLLMKVASNDEAKIYLNGKQLYRSDAARECVPDQDEVAGVELKAGLNALVFKVVNETGAWQGWVRLTDAAGQPVKGFRVTLDPTAKD
jgi:hypothetical protein